MLPKGANLQKIRNGKRTYAITPHIPGGFVKPEFLRKLADVAEKYHGVLKCTSAQRIMITSLQAEDIESAWQELGVEPAIGFANCVRSIKVCPGISFCKRGKQDSVKLGLELDRLYHKKEMPSRLKMGVAGCPNSCSEIYIKDIGVLGTDAGWNVYVGGSAGAHPRIGELLISDLSHEEVLQIVSVVLSYYEKHADIERIGQFIDRIGFKKFKADVLAAFYQGVSAEDAEPNMSEEKLQPVPGGLTEGTLVIGDPIAPDSVISDIIRVYPQTVPTLRGFGMGCLGCPSATAEPISQAASIHGVDVTELVKELNKVIGKEE
ncbi:MAG: DUF1858 domain-containing protein [Sporomusaceae bacterium]|nr:DUF1858 domain-containing protein [Sporomusaceae bacterium]